MELSEYFFSQVQGAVPLDAASLVELGNSMAIDIYAFFTYQTYGLRRPRFYSWNELHQQFGQGFSRVRAFKPKFMKNLAIVQTKSAEFRLEEAEDASGLWLYPKDPLIEAEARADLEGRAFELKH